MVPPCAVESPIRAAGLPPINTVDDPMAIVSGGPTQTSISPTQAAGIPPISTVGDPGGRTGPPTWGTPPGLIIGQTCMSVSRAAGNPIFIYDLSIYNLLFAIMSCLHSSVFELGNF
jgi:hypothetical protein